MRPIHNLVLLCTLCIPSLARAQPVPLGGAGQPVPEPMWMDVEMWFDVMFPWPDREALLASKEASPCSSAITSRIDGEFAGWHGDTVFKLANGQLWKQASNQVSHAYKHSPDAIVYWADGACKLKVSGMNDELFVERVE